MTVHYRARRISECIRRYEPAMLPNVKHGVRDTESGQVVAGPYDTAELARTQCRTLAAADIEALYLPDEAAFLARVKVIIAEQTDHEWAARLIWEYASGAKA